MTQVSVAMPYMGRKGKRRSEPALCGRKNAVSERHTCQTVGHVIVYKLHLISRPSYVVSVVSCVIVDHMMLEVVIVCITCACRRLEEARPRLFLLEPVGCFFISGGTSLDGSMTLGDRVTNFLLVTANSSSSIFDFLTESLVLSKVNPAAFLC